MNLCALRAPTDQNKQPDRAWLSEKFRDLQLHDVMSEGMVEFLCQSGNQLHRVGPP